VIAPFFSLSALLNQHEMSSLKPLLAALFLMALGILIAKYLEHLPQKPRPHHDNEQAAIVEAVLMASDTLGGHNPCPPPSSLRRLLSPQRHSSQLSRQDFHVSQAPHQEPETARAAPLRLALRRLPQVLERAVGH
jgi:hypothetical protein